MEPRAPCQSGPVLRSMFSWLIPCSREMIHVDDRLRERLRRFLWKIVTDAAGDQPMFVFAGEHLCIGAGFRVWRVIRISLECDCRHAYDRRWRDASRVRRTE